MESKINYTMVGAIVVLLLGALLSSILWLSVGFNQKEYASYLVYFAESVAGLSEQAPVKFNGVQVGFVKKIELNANDPRQVELTLSIEKNIPITTSTTATLVSQGITGVTYIGLSASSPQLTLIKKMDGEPYPVIPVRPSLFNQIDKVIKEVSENVNKVSMQTQKIFNEQNATYIRHTLANIEQVTHMLAENSIEIQNGIKKFNTMATDMSIAGQDVSKAMLSGKYTFEQMSQQTVPSITLLLQKLNAISANLQQVSNEMRQNPSVVIRGTTPPKPGPGE